MNPQALAQQCAEVINWNTTNGFPAEHAHITIVTPKGWKAPPRFPRGELLQVKEDGSRIRSLPAFKTLAWLAGHGLANVELKSLDDRENKPANTVSAPTVQLPPK